MSESRVPTPNFQTRNLLHGRSEVFPEKDSAIPISHDDRVEYVVHLPDAWGHAVQGSMTSSDHVGLLFGPRFVAFLGCPRDLREVISGLRGRRQNSSGRKASLGEGVRTSGGPRRETNATSSSEDT